jgi:uncharacterized Zn finger protein
MRAVTLTVEDARLPSDDGNHYCKHKSRLVLHYQQKKKNSEQRTAHHLYELRTRYDEYQSERDLFLSCKQENVINTETNGAFSR